MLGLASSEDFVMMQPSITANSDILQSHIGKFLDAMVPKEVSTESSVYLAWQKKNPPVSDVDIEYCVLLLLKGLLTYLFCR